MLYRSLETIIVMLTDPKGSNSIPIDPGKICSTWKNWRSATWGEASPWRGEGGGGQGGGGGERGDRDQLTCSSCRHWLGLRGNFRLSAVLEMELQTRWTGELHWRSIQLNLGAKAGDCAINWIFHLAPKPSPDFLLKSFEKAIYEWISFWSRGWISKCTNFVSLFR